MLLMHLGILKSYIYNISILMSLSDAFLWNSLHFIGFLGDVLSGCSIADKRNSEEEVSCKGVPGLWQSSSVKVIFLSSFMSDNSSCRFISEPSFCFCRQEIMDLVNKSGKFSDKFEAFTGISISKSIFSSSRDLTNIWLSSSQVLMVHWVKEWTILNLVQKLVGNQNTPALLNFSKLCELFR